MRIERIQLENFGLYAHRVFEFQAAPLVLVYGANESGKTTALNGIRQAVFGFRPRTAYLTGAPMCAEVVAEMVDGRRLEFKRRKGRPDDLSGSLDTELLSGEDIRRLLCELDLESYESLFGFSQEELRRGQDALKSARLTEALAGGSLGGIHALERLRADLGESLAGLYKSRGSKSQINLKLAEIKSAGERLRESEVLPSEIEELRRQLASAQLQSTQYRKEYEAEYRRKAAAQQKLAAFPKFQSLRVANAQLDQLEIPEQIDTKLLSQWTDFAEQRKTLAGRLEEEEAALAKESAEFEVLGGECRLFAHEPEIERLGHQAPEMELLRRRQSDVREQYQDAVDSRNKLVEQLQLESVSEKLLQFSVSAPQRQTLLRLAEDEQRLGREMLAGEAQRQAAQDTLESLQTHGLMEIPENLPELTGVVEQLRIAEMDAAQKSQLLVDGLAGEEFALLEERLRRPLPGGIELQPDWQVPSDAELAEFETEGREQQLLLEQTRAARKKLADELERIQQDNSQRHAQDATSVLELADDHARRRDAIIAHWLDELSQPLIAVSITVEQQQERLSELQRILLAGDQAQAELLEAADAVASRNHRRRQTELLAQQDQEASAREQQLLELGLQLKRRWKRMWDAVSVDIESVEPMRAWTRDYQQWVGEKNRHAKLRRESHQARGLVRSIRAQVLDGWPSNVREDVDLSVLSLQIQAWEQALRDRKEIEGRTRSTKEAVKNLARQLDGLQDRRNQIDQAYRDWWETVPLDAAWSLGQIGSLLDALEHLRRDHQIVERLERQIQEADASLEQFENDVRRLREQIADQASQVPVESLAAKWLKELHVQREKRDQRIRLGSQIEHRRHRVGEIKSRLTQLDARLGAACAATGAVDVAEAASILERVQDAEKLRAEIAQLNASLIAFCAEDQLDKLLEQLNSADIPSLEIEVSSCDRKLGELDQLRSESDETIGALQTQVEQLAGAKEAQRHLQTMQSLRGELVELAERWAVERLAQELLSRSIERFSRDHEPELLRLTRLYLSKLTGGKYPHVEHDKSNKGQFLVRNANGEGISPERLSTGAREQLYLAIRMAFIAHHGQDQEPLPVVMDDCFVNFDDVRARYAIEAIQSWDAATQTILLSCHSRIVQLVGELAPETPMICLDDNSQSTVGEYRRSDTRHIGPMPPAAGANDRASTRV